MNATSQALRVPTRFLALAGVSLVGTVGIGTLLRWQLAGEAVGLGSFVHLRSAHSHLGYYGVLFPLAWAAWARAGLAVPGPRTTAVYALATAAATVGFAREGYAPLSIAASTMVLGVWLLSAWQLRGHAFRRQSWLAAVSPSVALAAATIGVVAVTLDREWVQGFLALLVFGAVVPTALRAGGAPPPATGLWPLAVVGAALALGPLPHPATWLALAWLGVLVAMGGARSELPLDVRLLWMGAGAALVGMALQILPETHGVAIGGLHYVVLGPLLLTLVRPRVPAAARVVYGVAVAAFTLAVMLSWPVLAACLGTAIAGAWVVALLGRVARCAR